MYSRSRSCARRWIAEYFLAPKLSGASDNARGVLGCTLRFRPRENPRLYTLHFTLSTIKNRPSGHFIWSSQKNVVYLNPQFHAGDVCASSAGVADIFKRRLLRSVLTVRNLATFKNNQNLATVDVLRDIDYPSCAYLVCLLRINLVRMRVP